MMFPILILFYTSGCTTTVTCPELINKMNKSIAKKNSHINILWYKGSDEKYHYLGHVYKMFGSKSYRVSLNELQIKEMFPLTRDSEKWILIKKIGKKWKASRKYNDIWKIEEDGVDVIPTIACD